MGCNCSCIRKEEQKTEMIGGELPRENLNQEENQDIGNLSGVNEDLKFGENTPRLDNNTPDNLISTTGGTRYKNSHKQNNITEQLVTTNSVLLTQNLERNEIVFDFFNEIRTDPKKYETEAKSHEVFDIFEKYYEKFNNPNSLIKNPFYNLLLESSISNNLNKFGIDGLKQAIEKEEQIKDYKKELFVEDAPISEPEESVWNLLSNNKDNAINDFFISKIDYLIISSSPIKNSQKIKVFFLFLRKK